MPAAGVYSLLNKRENAHDDPIYCCFFTSIRTNDDTNYPSEEYLVTGGLDSLVKVWHFQKNKIDLLHTLAGHCMAVVSVAVSPNGQIIASASLDSTLMIWELTTGNKINAIKTNATDVWKVSFSPDGTHVVSGSQNGKLNVYNIVTNTVEKVLDSRGKFALSVAWSSDGKSIASGSVDGNVYVFDVSQGKLSHTLNAHAQTVRSIDFSPNSKLLVTGSNDGFVKVFDVANENHQGSLKLNTWVLSVCFSGDGSRVAVATADGRVTIALVKELKVLQTFQEHNETVCDLKFNASGNKLFSVSKDRSINIYECPIPTKNDKK
ncbi:WD repeat-containing protein 61-like [Nymphalis io]|uniref:WD repeat-containing protein 61-like n=1 Tax=Inachis io TaxID=171585 RepID=UPI0021683CAA|nr:WD repeat-containing protein 61-like [Nymphalis io]XP_050350299.1 WD repeat-containing protein 61-like [Nymphalis io]